MNTDQVLSRLDQALRQMVAAQHQANRLTRAHLKQWFKGPALQDLAALLKREIGYVPVSGKPIRVHVDDVLRIDELLRAGREAALRAQEVA